MQGIELSDYINSPAGEEEEKKQSSRFAILGVCKVACLVLGLICILQAVLNISLRLHPSEWPVPDVSSGAESSFNRCPTTWNDFRKGCYLVSTRRDTWNHAVTDCNDRGANLFTVKGRVQLEELYGSGEDSFWVNHQSVRQPSRGSKHIYCSPLCCVFHGRSVDPYLWHEPCDAANYWICEKQYK